MPNPSPSTEADGHDDSDMFTAALGLLIGAIAIQQITHLPSLWWVSGVLPLGVAAWRWPVARLFLWIALGMAWTVWRADQTLGPTWPAALVKRDVVLTGYVSGIPQTTEHRARFNFVVDSARLGKSMLFAPPQRVRLNWYGKAPLLTPGERWRLRVRLRPPNGFMNPGGFDYEAWLFRHGFGATGYVRVHGAERLPGLCLTPSVRLDRLREFLARRISAAVPEASERGILLALILGIRAGIPQDRWQTLLDTGTNHLIAISGLHIGLVAGLAFFLMRWLWASIPRLTLFLAAPRAAALFGLSMAALYAALAGFSVPTQRALIMLLVGFGGMLLSRQARPARSLATALLAILLLDPLVVLDAGFWLSFAAVAFILYAMSGREAAGWLHSWGRIQWALLLGLLPITVLLFQRTAPIAPLANLLAVPWVGMVVVPLALLGTLLLVPWPAAGGALLGGASSALGLIWPVLDALAAVPGAHWRVGASSLPAVVFALLGVCWVLAPRGWPGRGVGLLMLGPLLWPQPAYPPPGSWRLSLLDVGQGMAAVVQTAGHTLVFDAGPRFGERFDAGEAVLVPYLRSLGLRHLSLLVISHNDTDHSGGARSLLAAYPHTPVLASNPSRWPEARPCRAGEAWVWGGVRFEMLGPLTTEENRNDRSCVLRIVGDGGSALLVSDIEAKAERALVARWGSRLAAEVMIVPHHGSATSSTPLFLSTVDPRLALLSRGFGNRFDFPRAAVMRRYARRGIAVADTARSGALTVEFDRANGMQLLPGYRDRAGLYWNRVPGP